jgi:3-phenylpropionate/cinnamic acid dioxygenase small subunit
MDTLSQRLLRELQDRQAIEECVSRYAHGLDRHDEALIADVYHPDARDAHGPFDGSIPEFVTWVNALHESKTRAHTHNITTHWCELRGERAFADSYVIFVLYRREREIVMMGSGRYIDRLERRSGAWKIAERRVIIDMRFEAEAQPLGNTAGGYPTGTWDRTDLTYLRPLVLPSELESMRAGQPVSSPELSSPTPLRATEMLMRCAARRAIKDCITQSVRSLDRADRALALDQYAPGARIEDGIFRGSAEQHVEESLARFEREDLALTHNLSSHWVEVRERVAVAETYLTLMRFSRDGTSGWVGGLRLLDRLQEHEGRWRIVSRQVVADYELTANGSSVNTDAQYLRSRRDRGDISYDRR